MSSPFEVDPANIVENHHRRGNRKKKIKSRLALVCGFCVKLKLTLVQIEGPSFTDNVFGPHIVAKPQNTPRFALTFKCHVNTANNVHTYRL